MSVYLKKASFLLRESREPGCISVTYRDRALNCRHARYAYSSHQWTNVLAYVRQQQCGLLHLGQTEFDLTFELIKKSLKGKQASYLVGLEKDELKSAELLSAVIVYANEILYYVDLRNGEIMQLIDDAADRLVKDIVLLERGGYMAADEAQLDLIATITNKNRHKKLEFTEVDRETIGSRGEELLSLVCCEQKLNVERILLPSDDQVTDTLEYHNDGYKMMQQLDQQFNRFDLQDRSKKRRLSDEGQNRFHHDFGFFVE